MRNTTFNLLRAAQRWAKQTRLVALVLAPVALLLPLAPATAAPPIAAYYDGNTATAHLPINNLSYVIYAFTEPTDTFECAAPTHKQRRQLAALRQLRHDNPHLKVLISIGGWDAAPQFSDIVTHAQSRTLFARSCIERYIIGQKLDGIDLDWEFPVHGGMNKSRPSDRANFTKLARDIRAQLDKLGAANDRHYLLTAAVPAARYEKDGPYVVTDSYNLKALTPVLDWFNVMTYDFGTAFSPVSNFNQPMYANPNDPTPEPQRKWNNVTGAVTFFEAHGVPASKIMLGVGFYGRGFVGVSSQNAGLYSQYDTTFSFSPWRKIRAEYLDSPDWTRHWSDTAQAPWLYNTDKHVLLSYEDPKSMGIKAKFIRDKGLKGAMIWEIGLDDAQHSLLNALAAPWND